MVEQVGSLTPQRVAGALKRAGLDASKRSTTSVRGWSDTSEGFRTTLDYPRNGTVIVSWNTGGHHHRPIREKAMLLKMTEILEKEGFKVGCPSAETFAMTAGGWCLTVQLKQEGVT